MRKTHRILLTALLCLGLFLPVSAQQAERTAKVTGQVVNAQGHYLMTTVLLTDLDQNTRTTHFTDLSGRFELQLPKGNYLLTLLRDATWERMDIPLTITSRIPKELGELELKQLYDIRSLGWYSGDLHQHSINSDGSDTPLDVLFADVAMGADFGFITDHNSVDGVREYTAFPEVDNGPSPFLAMGGVEVTTPEKGHFNVLNTDSVYAHELNSAEGFAASVQSAKGGERFVQINHPSRRDILGFAYPELYGLFDGMEVWNGKDLPPLYATNLNAKEEWYALLNSGLRLTATASSDVHSVAGNALHHQLDELTRAWYTRGTFAAMPRTYLQLDQLTPQGIIGALKAGRAFLSNGPMVLAAVDGITYGGTVPPGKKALHYEAMNNEELTVLRLVLNGEVMEERPLEGMAVQGSFDVALQPGDFIVLEAEAVNLGYALTNPIYCEK